jgi:hypothetical protein
VRAEPTGEVGGDEAGVLTPLPPCGWDDWKRRRARVRGWRPNRPPGRVALRARVS